MLLMGVLLCAMAAPVCAQATRTTILTNGPTANRINIVVLSEGYQATQFGKFLVDATNAVNHLLTAPPYQEYKSYFNAFAISVASTNSGSDHPAQGVFKNTYFNSSYDSFGIASVITIPPNDRDTNYNNGQGKVVSLLTSLMPEYDLVILLVNDLEYGGSGGEILISSVHVSAREIVAHESGHAFAGLTDEYSFPFPGYTPTEKPNATAQTNRSQIKWALWIDDTTPIPTPESSAYANLVGLFQGAQYQSNGWYRPKLDCKMRTLGVPFCEVCSEAVVKSIYQPLRSIEAMLPASTDLSITGTEAQPFTITTLQPTTHDLSAQWFTNGTAVGGATNFTFALLPETLGNGNHVLRVEVRDRTPLVRHDPANVLSNSTAWTLNVRLNELRLISPQWLAGGRFSFCVTGTVPQSVVIQASTNLSTWTPVWTNPLAGGGFCFTNQDAADFPRRFYRATAGP